MIFEELKSCPFCGGNATLLYGKSSQLKGGMTQAFVQCSTCKAKTKTFIHKPYQLWDADQCAMNAWNNRW